MNELFEELETPEKSQYVAEMSVKMYDWSYQACQAGQSKE